MSLAFSFQLTPRQTQVLLCCAFGHYKKISEHNESLLPDYGDVNNFVAVGSKLIQKGLLSHDNSRNPTWMPTERGITVANMIVDDAAKLVATRDTAKEIKPIQKKAKT